MGLYLHVDIISALSYFFKKKSDLDPITLIYWLIHNLKNTGPMCGSWRPLELPWRKPGRMGGLECFPCKWHHTHNAWHHTHEAINHPRSEIRQVPDSQISLSLDLARKGDSLWDLLPRVLRYSQVCSNICQGTKSLESLPPPAHLARLQCFILSLTWGHWIRSSASPLI